MGCLGCGIPVRPLEVPRPPARIPRRAAHRHAEYRDSDVGLRQILRRAAHRSGCKARGTRPPPEPALAYLAIVPTHC